jgi:hypothetical protein
MAKKGGGEFSWVVQAMGRREMGTWISLSVGKSCEMV